MDNAQTAAYEMTARDYLRVIFRQKAVVIICVLTVMLTVYFGLRMKTPVYEAAVKMLISAEKQVDSPYYRELMAGRNIEVSLTQSEIVKSNPVIERATVSLKLYEQPLDYERQFADPLKGPFLDAAAAKAEKQLQAIPEDARAMLMFQRAVDALRARVKVEPVRDTNLFTITVSDYSPVAAAIMANVVSRSYVIFDLEQQLAELRLKYGSKHLTVQQLQDNIEKMIASLNGQPLANIDAIGPASVKIIEQSQIPLQPSGPPKKLILLLAALMSVFLGVMLAFVFEYMDPTFKSVVEVERYFNLPFLGSVPKRAYSEKVFLKDAKRSTLYTNFYRTLADQLYLIMRDRKYGSAIITSAERGEGVSTVAANLGYYLAAKLHHKVLLIDANLRAPKLHAMFGVPNEKGLSGVLEGKVEFEQSVKHIADKLYIVPAGETDLNPVILLDTVMMESICRQARERFEMVLIDAPHLNGFRDAALISNFTDGVMLVISEGSSRRQVVKSAIEPLHEHKSTIMGIILNNRSFPIPKAIYNRI